jgi:hypothetical protein
MRSARVVLALAGATLVVGGLSAASQQGLITEDSAIQVALALAVVAIGSGSGWVLGRVHRGAGLLLQVGGLLTGAGVLRHLDVIAPIKVVTGASWLLAPAALLAACLQCLPREAGSRSRQWSVGLLWATVVTAIATAVAGGRVGPGSITRFAAGSAVTTGSRLLLGVHVVLLAASVVAVLAAERSSAVPGAPRRTMVVALAAWGIVTVVGEGVHLLDVGVVFQLVHGEAAYRDWTAALTLNLPLAAAVGLIVSLTYTELIRPRLLRTRSGDLALDDDPLEVVEDQLAVWTGDPTIRIGYATASTVSAGWTDRDGRPFVPSRSRDRSLTTLTRGGTVVAVLEHDSSLDSQPGAVEIAANITALAIDSEAAAAHAGSRVDEARRVSARLLAAEDDARAALTDELERGPIAELGALAATVRSSGGLAGVADRIRAVTTDVRTISHGVYPPELDDGGLAAALPGAGAIPTRRLPRAVEVTVFLLARDAPEARIVDRGTFVEVHLADQELDPHALDRVGILGGTIEGTRIDLPTEGT